MSTVGKIVFDSAQSFSSAEVTPRVISSAHKKTPLALDRASGLGHSFSASVHSMQSSLWKVGEIVLRDVGAPAQLVQGAGLKQSWHAQQAQMQLQSARDRGFTTTLSEVHDAGTLASFLAHGTAQALPPLASAAAGALYATRLGAPAALGVGAAWYLPSVGEVLIHQPAQDADLPKAAAYGAGLTALAVSLPGLARNASSLLSGIGLNSTAASVASWLGAGSTVAQTQTVLLHSAAASAMDAGPEFKNQLQQSGEQGALLGSLGGLLQLNPARLSLAQSGLFLSKEAHGVAPVFPKPGRVIEMRRNATGTWVSSHEAETVRPTTAPDSAASIGLPIQAHTTYGARARAGGVTLNSPRSHPDEFSSRGSATADLWPSSTATMVKEFLGPSGSSKNLPHLTSFADWENKFVGKWEPTQREIKVLFGANGVAPSTVLEFGNALHADIKHLSALRTPVEKISVRVPRESSLFKEIQKAPRLEETSLGRELAYFADEDWTVHQSLDARSLTLTVTAPGGDQWTLQEKLGLSGQARPGQTRSVGKRFLHPNQYEPLPVAHGFIDFGYSRTPGADTLKVLINDAKVDTHLPLMKQALYSALQNPQRPVTRIKIALAPESEIFNQLISTTGHGLVASDNLWKVLEKTSLGKVLQPLKDENPNLKVKASSSEGFLILEIKRNPRSVFSMPSLDSSPHIPGVLARSGGLLDSLFSLNAGSTKSVAAPRSRRVTSLSHKVIDLVRAQSKAPFQLDAMHGLAIGGLNKNGLATLVLKEEGVKTQSSAETIKTAIDGVRRLSADSKAGIKEINLWVPKGAAGWATLNAYLNKGLAPADLFNELKNVSSFGIGLEGLHIAHIDSTFEGDLLQVKLKRDSNSHVLGWYDPSRIGRDVKQTNLARGWIQYSRGEETAMGREMPDGLRLTLEASSLDVARPGMKSLISDLRDLKASSHQLARVGILVPLETLPFKVLERLTSDYQLPSAGARAAKNALLNTAWGQNMQELGFTDVHLSYDETQGRIAVHFF